MYRITINPETGAWVIELQVMYLFWKKIGKQSFLTYDDARKEADKLGLDNVYRDYAKSYTHQVMRGAM